MGQTQGSKDPARVCGEYGYSKTWKPKSKKEAMKGKLQCLATCIRYHVRVLQEGVFLKCKICKLLNKNITVSTLIFRHNLCPFVQISVAKRLGINL